jgi:hypothetical protein
MDESYPVFHVSNLKPHQPDEEDSARNQPARAALDFRPHKPKEVEEILAERTIGGPSARDSRHQYLVKWKNLGAEEISWEHARDLEKFKQQIEDFKTKLAASTVIESADSLSGGEC